MERLVGEEKNAFTNCYYLYNFIIIIFYILVHLSNLSNTYKLLIIKFSIQEREAIKKKYIINFYQILLSQIRRKAMKLFYY